MTRMKESGIDWIGQIPEEWEMSKIRYLVTTRSEKRITDSSVPYIGLENIESQTGKFVKTGIQVDKSENIVVEIGDVLFGKLRPYLRKYWRATFTSTVSSEFLVFQSSELDMNFLYYAIQSDSFIEEVNTSTYGSKMPRASWEYIKNMRIAFPTSLVEQQKIADFLDKKTAQLDKVKALLEEQIQKLRDYRASLIYETVTKGLDKTVPMKDSGIDWIGQVPQGWGVNRLKYLANKIGSGKTPLGGSEIFEETGILFIRSQNIYNGLILLEDKATYINRNIHQQMIGTCVKKNDILLNITGASIGRVAKYDLDIEANVNQHVCIIRSNRYVLPDYLMYFIMSEFGQFMIKTHQISGNREGLSFENIGNFKIIAPGLDYQYEISQYLNKKMLTINQMIKTKEQQIENINKQRQTLIYDYVTGKRRV
ncbi:type I restriction modification DNA specificity protein [Streptococcus pneumoniae]|nr:type I restriction modification DNA specificity protein [Streptococcus pneumoniae]